MSHVHRGGPHCARRVALGQHLLAVRHWRGADDVLGEDAGCRCRLVCHDQRQVCLLACSPHARMHACTSHAAWEAAHAPAPGKGACLPWALKPLGAHTQPLTSRQGPGVMSTCTAAADLPHTARLWSYRRAAGRRTGAGGMSKLVAETPAGWACACACAWACVQPQSVCGPCRGRGGALPTLDPTTPACGLLYGRAVFQAGPDAPCRAAFLDIAAGRCPGAASAASKHTAAAARGHLRSGESSRLCRGAAAVVTAVVLACGC